MLFRDASGEAELATKRDIERLEGKIDARFERLDGEMRLNRWMLGVIVVAEVAPLLGKLFNISRVGGASRPISR